MQSKLTITSTSALALLCGATSCEQSAAERPNIVIIYTDDMGIGDLSCYNSGWIQTPNIDRLADEGIKFNNFYSAAPVSSASRVAITTGMFPANWGINTFLAAKEMNEECWQHDYLVAEAPSMARQLQAAGYKTAHIGKWHMGGGRKVVAPSITEYGFDEYLSTWESPDPAKEITSKEWIWSLTDSIQRWDRTQYFVDKSLEFLAKHKGEPCFVNLWPDDVHSPWVHNPETAIDKPIYYIEENFRPVMERYDREIGRFMEGLERLGLRDNTIVIFTSDNGPSPSFESKRTVGMRGTKNSLYEGGVNMPFIISWPAGIKECGVVDDESVISSVDLFPALCKIAGAELPEQIELDGEDISATLLGECSFERTKPLIWCFGWTPRFVRYVVPENNSPHLAIRKGDWKLLTNIDGSATELYNMVSDRNERQNVAEKHSSLVAELKAEVLDWWASQQKNMNLVAVGREPKAKKNKK